MKHKLFPLVLGLLLVAVTVPRLHAVPITGSIDMTGTATLDSTLLGSATMATAFSGVVVGGLPTGSFSTVTPGTGVTWLPFGWAPATTPVLSLWSFVFGPDTYSFDLTTVSVFLQSNAFLNLFGTGTLHKTGFDSTGGSWSFTISNAGGGAHSNFAFTFANSQTAAVPEGGSSIALLGMGLMGLGALGRKFARKA